MKRILIAAVTIILVHVANAQWTQCPLFGGNIFSLASVDSNVYSGTLGNGIFLSTNFGQNWDSINNGLPINSRASSIATRGNEIFAGITDAGMFKSINNGASWTSINNGMPSLYFSSREIIFADSNIFITSGPWGIYMSSDDGNTWTSRNGNLPDSLIKTLACDSTGIYTSVDLSYGVFKSTDYGLSWFSVNNGMPTMGFTTMSLTTNSDGIYAAIEASYNEYRVYKSTDGGANWVMTLSISSRINKLFSNNDKVYIGTVDGVYESINGNNWVTINSGLTNKFITSFTAVGNDVFAGTTGGVFLLTDSSTSWVSVNNGISSFSFNAIENIGNTLFAGERLAGVYISSDNGNTWETRNNGLTSLNINVMAVADDKVFVGYFSKFYYTTLTGSNWTTLSSSSFPYSYTVNAIAAKETNVFFTIYDGSILKSFDYGTTWTSSVVSTTSFVTSLTIGENSNIYAALSDVGVMMSADSGSTWTLINNGFAGLSYVKKVVTNDNTIFASLGYYNPPIVTSSDNGATWKVGTNGLFGHDVVSLKSIGNSVLAGLNDGLFYTYDMGDSWIDMSGNLPHINVLSIGRDDSCVFVGIEGKGIWNRPLSDFAIDFTENNIIDISSNITIYPNPATDLVYINYEENATVEIINMQGQLVATKTLKEKNSSIDVSGLRNGVYSLRVKTGSEVITKKIVKQ